MKSERGTNGFMRVALKFFSLLSLIVLFSSSAVLGQDQRPRLDVVYLENGGVRKGRIVERKPGESIKIETVEGQVFVYKISEIKRIERGTRVGQGRRGEQVQEKNPYVAAGLSFLFVGGGQYYNEQYLKGGALTGLYIGGWSIAFAAPENEGAVLTGLAIASASALYSLIDAPIVASNINDRARRQSRFGHLMEFQHKEYTVGLDPVHSRNGNGVRVAVHF
jgi:hypothetical protein